MDNEDIEFLEEYNENINNFNIQYKKYMKYILLEKIYILYFNYKINEINVPEHFEKDKLLQTLNNFYKCINKNYCFDK